MDISILKYLLFSLFEPTYTYIYIMNVIGEFSSKFRKNDEKKKKTNSDITIFSDIFTKVAWNYLKMLFAKII